MDVNKVFEKVFENLKTVVEISTLRKELVKRVTSELGQPEIKWATKFANATLKDQTYSKKDVEEGGAICDLFTKTYICGMKTFDKPTEPYELWKVGELFFVRKDNEDDIQKILDIILSDRTTPSSMYIVTVSEGELVAEKVNTLKFIRNHGELDRPIPTIVNKKEEEPTTTKEDEAVPNKILTLSTLQNHMRAMLGNVQPDKLEEVITGSRIARAIFCNMYPVKYELFTRYTVTFLSMEPEDFSDDMNRLATQLTIIFSFININLNAQLLAYAIYHHHDNAELDIHNVVYNIIETADMLRKDGSI
jgi:hypothetical protein